MKWLGVVLLAGCAYGSLPETPSLTDGNVETVVHSDMCININRCSPFEPWRRLGWDDASGPVHWLVSISGGACVVDAQTFAIALSFVNNPYKCESKWRRPRP